MATERKWDAIPPQYISGNGTIDGAVPVADSTLFKVKQQVYLKSDTHQPALFEIKKVPNSTTLLVGLLRDPISVYYDVSSYTLSDNAQIYANEQNRNSITHEAIDRATYEEEPTMARRMVPVDPSGKMYGPNNPMPVTSSVDSGGLAPSNFDDIQKVLDADDDTIRYNFFLNGAQVGAIDVFYNSNKTSTEFKKGTF